MGRCVDKTVQREDTIRWLLVVAIHRASGCRHLHLEQLTKPRLLENLTSPVGASQQTMPPSPSLPLMACDNRVPRWPRVARERDSWTVVRRDCRDPGRMRLSWHVSSSHHPGL